jgi:hypothetical protein
VENNLNPEFPEYMTLSEAAKLIPGRKPGRRVSTDTVWRWCLRGVSNGLRLKSVLIGGQRCTTRRWLQEFIEARSLLSEPEAVPQPRSSGQRESESKKAAEELRHRWKKA